MKQTLKYLLLLLCCWGCKLTTDTYVANVEEHRRNIDALFSNEKASPLNDIDRAAFKGLEYFPIDKNFSVDARIEKYDSVRYLEIKHTLNRTYPFIVWGVAHFKLLNDSCKLTIYLTAEKESKTNMLFIPFKDASNGMETYGGGRYLDMEMPTGNTANLDFNLAYNPNCAYSDNWSCPLVPEENTLQTAVRAGVKTFERQH